jgi:hypothetical protein
MLQTQSIFLYGCKSPYVVRSIYFEHFHPHLRYGLTFWGGDSKRKSIFKLQQEVLGRTNCLLSSDTTWAA